MKNEKKKPVVKEKVRHAIAVYMTYGEKVAIAEAAAKTMRSASNFLLMACLEKIAEGGDECLK